jgi:hypothetical protein
MKLREILTEKRIENPNKLAEIIKRDCGPFLTEAKLKEDFDFLGGHKGLFFRGTKHINDGIIKGRRYDKGRIPKDTPQDLHNQLNVLFKKKFKWSVRDGIFATSNDAQANGYGYVHVFFPIGKFKYVWSPGISDLWDHMNNMDLDSYLDIPNIEDRYDEWENDVGDFIDEMIMDNYGMRLGLSHTNGTEVKNVQRYISDLFDDDYDYDGVLYSRKKKVWYMGMYKGSKKIKLIVTKAGAMPMKFDDKQDIRTTHTTGEIKRLQKLVDSYKDTGMSSAARLGHEVAFWCDEYYLVAPQKLRYAKLT